MENEATCGISVIMKSIGMKRKDALAHIEAGRIIAANQGRQLVFEISEKVRLEKLHDMYIGFFYVVSRYIDKKHSFTLTKGACRNDLIEFMETNAWFGAEVLPITEVFFADIRNEAYFVKKTDETLYAAHLQLWLSTYGKNAEYKRDLLLARLCELYPITGKQINLFLSEEYPNEATASWILVDFLCGTLSLEITKTDDKALETLAKVVDKKLPLNSARIFSAFLTFLRSKRKLGNGWSYQFNARSEKEKSAYPIMSYFKMAYIVFNEDAWKSENLVEKALSSESCANLWVFVAFHFVCGWRGSDIVNIPMPNLPCDGESVRKQLLNETFDTESLLSEIEMRLLYTPQKPNKTKNYNVPELKMFVAESFRKPLGFIVATAVSFQKNASTGGAFIRRAGNVKELQDFFGTDFIVACENKSFNTRRANKSYLQGIEMSAGNTPGKPKGYMLAALARSHKGGYGALPKTTEIYLRDARFSGYSPEFIAREMFERGIFSFIPALLMDMYEGKPYEKLPVSTQTVLLAEMGISPSGLENLALVVEQSLCKARQAVAIIMEHPHGTRENIDIILQNIANGSATGRQEGCLCLMTAAEFNCIDTDRSCCIGCGYEIYTKSILRLLVSEYSRLLERKRASEGAETVRLDAIIKKAVLPAITEIAASAERLYPGADIKPLLSEIVRGVGLC